MKKILSVTALFLLAAGLCFAELYPYSRYVEIGVDAKANADENVKTADEIFVKEIVFDLTQMYKSMGDDGMVVDAGAGAKAYITTNFGKKFSSGLCLNVDGSANIGLSKDFFQLLGEGNELDVPIVTKVSASMELFVELGMPLKFKIGKGYLKMTPSYFLPIVYFPQPDATITVTTESNGTMTAEGVAKIAVYTPVGMGTVFDSQLNYLGVDGLLNELSGSDAIVSVLQSGGVDLSASFEIPVLRTIDVGLYTHVPIKPADLKYCASGTVTYSATLDPVLDSVSGGKSVSYTTDGPNYGDGITFAELSDGYAVNRPLRLGMESAWRPFGNWCTFRSLLGCAARNPFGQDFSWSTSLYPEYSIGADLRILYVFGFNFASAYKQQVFIQSAGLALNFRVFELDVDVASTSAGSSFASFLKSWQVSGLQGKVGVRIGF